MSSTYASRNAASRCIDGRTDGYFCHSRGGSGETNAWLSIDLSGHGVVMSVHAIRIYNRPDCCKHRLGHHQIWVGMSSGDFSSGQAKLCADWTAPSTAGPFDYDCDGLVGTHVTVLLPGNRRMLNLNEVFIASAVALPPRVPIWPTWPEDATSPGVSRPVVLVGGQRYWMQLECTMAENYGATCAVGTRILALNSPRAALLDAQTRRWKPRAVASTSCSAINDGPTCCATIDKDGNVCVAATTSFAGGAVCSGWSALQAATLPPGDPAVAACPFSLDPVTKAVQPRTKLAAGFSCNSITDRVTCCSAIDGRLGTPTTPSVHEDAPCVPAVTAFSNGAVCESVSYLFASEIELAQSVASCAELSGDKPLLTPFGEEARVANEMQRLTFTQPPAKLTQDITMTRIDCEEGVDCSIGSWTNPGTVKLLYAGQSSSALSVKASASEIEAALRALPQQSFDVARVTTVAWMNSTIVWTVELTMPFVSCGSAAAVRSLTSGGPSSLLESGRPLFAVEAVAKVVAKTVITAGDSCLDGGVDISMVGINSSLPPFFLPADATSESLTTTLNALLGVTTAAEGVLVKRTTDGPSKASFTITFLGGGTKPLLRVISNANNPLLYRTYSANFLNSTTSYNVSVTVERIAPGGIDLTPIPGRYLSAPTDRTALRLRLASQTTARCAAPNWEVAHVGCFSMNSTNYTDAYADQPGSARTFDKGFSLERCAIYCQDAVDAVAFGAELDLCTCFSAASMQNVKSECTERPTLPPYGSMAFCQSIHTQYC